MTQEQEALKARMEERLLELGYVYDPRKGWHEPTPLSFKMNRVRAIPVNGEGYALEPRV